MNYNSQNDFTFNLESIATSSFNSGYFSDVAEVAGLDASTEALSELNLASINITATSDKNNAEAYFVSADVSDEMHVNIRAEASQGEDYGPSGEDGTVANASLTLGDITILADANDDARAGFVSASQASDAESAFLDITARLQPGEDYYGNVAYSQSMYGSEASVDIGNISITAESDGRNDDATAFIVSGARDNSINIEANLDNSLSFGGNVAVSNFVHESDASVVIKDIHVRAETSNTGSNAKAFAVGSAYANDSEADATFNIIAYNGGVTEDTSATVSIGDIHIEAEVTDPDTADNATPDNTSALAFVAGDLLGSNTGITDNLTAYQTAEFTLSADADPDGLASIDVGNILVSASTVGDDSEAEAFIAGNSITNFESTITSNLEGDVSLHYQNIEANTRLGVNANADDRGQANVDMGNVSVSATTAGYVSDVEAFMVGHTVAYGNISVSEDVTKTGNISLSTGNAQARASNNVDATVEVNFSAYADGANGESNIVVGDINLSANASGDSSDAKAFMAGYAEVYARADAFAEMTINGLDGNISIAPTATAEAYATADASVRVAIIASGDNAESSVQLGDINIEANAGDNGDALAFMAGFAGADADAYAEALANGTVTGGGSETITVIATENETVSSNAAVRIEASADGVDGDASVDIGSIQIKAAANGTGDVEAFMVGYADEVDLRINAEANNGSSDASITIGNISVEATQLEGNGEVTAFMAGQAGNPNGPGDVRNANLEIIAEADEDGDFNEANITLGDIKVAALADHGNATAALVLNNQGDPSQFNDDSTAAATELGEYQSASTVAATDLSQYGSASTVAATDLSQYESASTVADSEQTEYQNTSTAASTDLSQYQSASTAAATDLSQYESASTVADSENAAYSTQDSTATEEQTEYQNTSTAAFTDLSQYESASTVADSEQTEYQNTSTAASTDLSQYQSASTAAATELSQYESASTEASTSYPEGKTSEFLIESDAEDNAITDVTIGNISITANGDDAIATLAYSEFSGTDGEISAEASESGTANLTIADITVCASAADDAKAMLLYSGTDNIVVPEGQEYRADLDIESDADDLGTSDLVMGNISVNATSTLGEAQAALVYNTNYVASLDISADASEYANANLTIGNISVSAEALAGDGDVTASLVTLTDFSGYAYLDITANANEYGTANVTIGNIEVTAEAYAGDATATLLSMSGTSSSAYAYLDITSDANEYATAQVTINSIDVRAVASSGEAVATLVASSGYAGIEIGAESDDNQSLAELNIVNGIHVAATSSGNAYATLMSGNGNGRIYATAYDDGQTHVTIKDIEIHAVSFEDSAYAAFSTNGNFNIVASAYTDGDSDGIAMANITITDGISVKATAAEEAYAAIDGITSFADEYGTANVTIGDIEVIAAGSAENTAYISTIRVEADDHGYAEMNIGDITLTAGVFDADWQDGFVVDTAYTEVDFSADADDDSTAILEVGNISLVSDARGGSQGTAYATLEIDVRAGNYYGNLSINDESYAKFKAGDISVTSRGLSAGEDSASIDIFADTSNYDANAVIEIGNITLTSQLDITRDEFGPFGEALSLNIQASTAYGDNATVNVGDININLEGDAASLGIVNIGEAGNASIFGFPSGGDIDNSYDQINIGNLTAYIEDEQSALVVDINRVMWDQERYAAFSGDGAVILAMDSGDDVFGNDAQMTFGKIYLADMDTDQDGNIDIEADFDGQFFMNFGYDVDNNTLIPDTGFFTFEESVGTPGLVPHTTIYGYDISNDSSISFNGITAMYGTGNIEVNSEFIDLNDSLIPETNVNELWADIIDAFANANDNLADGIDVDTDLDDFDYDDNTFVYRLFDERAGTYDDDTDDTDLNGDGYFSSRLGVLAYDQEIEGGYGGGYTGSLTALVFLNDLNGNLDAESISGVGI
ncbi:hypothetical protein MCESTEHM2_00893 [Candidatus Methylopumilus universalis]|uniref:beta strand repeat-containing protein n=1 Tax=Candidatus Methylopumilus universalis TaxID=2588536 RepID=UPI003BEF2A6C